MLIRITSMKIIDNIKENIMDYVETRINIIKLKAINTGGNILSGIIAGVLAALLGFFMLFFLSFSAAYAISSAAEKPFLGFLCVGGFYLLLLVLVIALKDKIIKGPIVNSFMKKFYNKPGIEQNGNGRQH
jgi:hypothetical protein